MGLGVLGARATTGVAEQLTRLAVPADAAASRAAGGPGGDRRCRGGAGGGAGAPRPAVVGGVAAVHRSAAAGRRRRRRRPRPWPLGAAALPEPAGCPADRRRRRPRRGAAVPGRPAAARAGGRRGPLAAAADGHAAGRAGHLVCRHDGRDGAGQRLCLVPGRARVLLRARAVQAGAGAAGQRRAVGRGRRRPSTTPGSPTSGGPTRRSSPGYATPPASPLVSGSAESLLPFADLGQQGRRYRHRRGHPRADRGGHGGAGGRPADPHLCRVQQRAAVPDRPGRAGPGRAGPRRRVRPVVPAADLADRHRLGRPDADRGGRVPDPRRHRHLLHPVRQVPVVPVGPEGGAGPPASSGCCCGGSSSGWPACRPRGARGCWSSARAWAPGPARTSSCSRASRASTTTASTGPCGWGCRGWPSGPAAA